MSTKSQNRQNQAARLFELLSSGASDINKLLEALSISIDQLDDLFDSNAFTQRSALQTRLTLFQCRQIGLKLLPELIHRLHQLTESDKPETARRAINTFLNMAGIPTQPLRLPSPPKLQEPIDETSLNDLRRQYPDVYGIPYTDYEEKDEQSQNDTNHESGQSTDHDENQTRDDTDEESDQDDDQEESPEKEELRATADRLLDLKRNHNLDLTRLAPADYPRLTDFLLSLHSPTASTPASPVSYEVTRASSPADAGETSLLSDHTNPNPIESTVSSSP